MRCLALKNDIFNGNFDGLALAVSVRRVKGSSERKACQNFVRDIGEVERMLTLIKSLKKQTLESSNPGPLSPS